MVPVLVPSNLMPAMHRLEQLRHAAGVRVDNPYFFGATQGSVRHPQGSQEFSRVVSQVNGLAKPELLTATKFRHRASISFRGMDASDTDRSLFYSHMGHAKKINEDVYQHPRAIQEVIRVGGYLQRILGN